VLSKVIKSKSIEIYLLTLFYLIFETHFVVLLWYEPLYTAIPGCTFQICTTVCYELLVRDPGD
jgi:hypothetical protein